MPLPKLSASGGAGLPLINESYPMDHDSISSGHTSSRLDPYVLIRRHLPPELKRSVKQAVRSLSSNPFSGERLLRELTDFWKYKVRRFRLIYEVDRKARLIRIFTIGH
jgi:mRNA-degrading endonuclease RelE of RelBE toxin-antitoxin system